MFTKANLYKIASRIINGALLLAEKIIELIGKAYNAVQKRFEAIPNWSTREVDHPAIIRFGVVIILILIAVSVKYIVSFTVPYRLPFMIFYSVVVASAWYGGLRPGLLATAISSVLVGYIYLPMAGDYPASAMFIAVLVFALECCLIVALSHTMHRALQNLEEKKSYSQYYASIAQHISDAVISTDINLTIQSWNQGAEMLYGWKRHEVMHKPLHEVVPIIATAHTRRPLSELLEHEGHWRGEVLHQRKNGSRTYVLSSMSWLHDDEKNPIGIVMVNRDITDRKKLEQGKDDFIALASHELKTPLTSIQLYSSILKQRFQKTHDNGSMVYLNKIDEQMSKLLELVNHLLDVSKVQAGKIKFNVEKVDFDSFIARIVHDIQLITKTHKIEIKGKTGLDVELDKDRFRQVIVNLLNNAVKYSAQADTVIVTLAKEHAKDGTHAKVSIQDFGVGIPKEKQSKIFDRFYQVTDESGYTYSGLGLGLYISREIIEKHHGTLELESEVGKGSTFFVSIPSISTQKKPVQNKHEEKTKNYSYRR